MWWESREEGRFRGVEVVMSVDDWALSSPCLVVAKSVVSLEKKAEGNVSTTTRYQARRASHVLSSCADSCSCCPVDSSRSRPS